MDADQLRRIIEAALLAAGTSLDVPALQKLFEEDFAPERDEVQAALEDIEADCRDRGFELKQTASGYRFQVKEQYASWVGKLWEEKPKKYSRATLETLALIAYRQPLTRGDIEQVRGVAVSSDIIRTLYDRAWIRSVGHRDVPGRPTLYATTRDFLDHFNLKSLEDLPPLSEIRELSAIDQELQFDEVLGDVAGRADADAVANDLARESGSVVEPGIASEEAVDEEENENVESAELLSDDESSVPFINTDTEPKSVDD